MAKFHNGYDDIKVKLLNFAGNDLARQVVMFGNLAEFYEGIGEGGYTPDNEFAQHIVDEIIEGKTFPKYALEGHSVAFQIEGISRVCLAQLTRERGFFCSASGDVRPLTQDFITPKYIYNNKEWMSRLEKIQREIEDLYIDMCEGGVSYMDARYFGFHAQTISLTYTAPVSNWLRSCNSRTENNFADEINYIYRLMLNELKKAVEKEVTDPLSKKLWNWLLNMADNKSFYKRDHTYNNDFQRFPTPEGYEFSEPAHNDWRTSSWELELEKIYRLQPELLLPGEKEMIENWMKLEAEGKELSTTYDKNFELVAAQRIKEASYYRTKEERGE